jgi:hypothetical protein
MLADHYAEDDTTSRSRATLRPRHTQLDYFPHHVEEDPSTITKSDGIHWLEQWLNSLTYRALLRESQDPEHTLEFLQCAAQHFQLEHNRRAAGIRRTNRQATSPQLPPRSDLWMKSESPGPLRSPRGPAENPQPCRSVLGRARSSLPHPSLPERCPSRVSPPREAHHTVRERCEAAFALGRGARLHPRAP